jgi:hypothetical protein
MQPQTKSTASGFIVAPLSERRILTNAHGERGSSCCRTAAALPRLLPCELLACMHLECADAPVCVVSHQLSPAGYRAAPQPLPPGL